MRQLYMLLGKSAAGKDTIYQRLRTRTDLIPILLYTTRPIRQGEKEGVTYHYVTEDTMHQMAKEGKILECRTYQTVYGPWHYFTADDDQFAGLREEERSGGADNEESRAGLMIGTPNACQKLQAIYGRERVIPIYIRVEDGLRLQRALDRERRQSSPAYAEMCRRFLADQKDFAPEILENLCGLRVYDNIDIDKCVAEIERDLFPH